MEKEIRNKISNELLQTFPKKEASKKLKSVDTDLEVLERTEALGVNAPLAFASVVRAVQEPDSFWDHCVYWAYEKLGRPDINIPTTANLVELLAINEGVTTLREAYKLESFDF